MVKANRMTRMLGILSVSLMLAAGLTACAGQTTSGPAEKEATAPADKGTVLLATTTSTVDTGILDELKTKFETESGFKLKFFSVGSGEALKMGEDGNVDVLLVHSKKSEEEYMAKGRGLTREKVMHNFFVVVGAKDDPAKVKGSVDATAAFKNIAAAKAGFISRGDDSGTHKKELGIWEKAAVTPKGDWYIETGQGMGETLRIASEKQGYTLSDEATFLKTKTDLSLLIEGSDDLLNQYSVIVVKPIEGKKSNRAGGEAFAKFVLSPTTQEFIAGFGKAEFGKSLFTPDAGK